MPKTFTSWSVSRYHDYKQCPLKAKLKHLDKIQEPKNQAMERGAAIHTLAEKYIRSEIKTMPEELTRFAPLFEALRKRFKRKTVMTVVEDSWAYTKAWAITTWDDWTGCWLRVKVDTAWEESNGVLLIKDWKTGKFRDSDRVLYEEQLELYALAAFLQPPYKHIHTVKGELVYLDLGLTYPTASLDVERLTFVREQEKDLRKRWETRVKAMFSDTKFAPKPNALCKWCFYRKSNAINGGGQCPL